MERREDALERKARIYGQVLGCVATAGASDPGDKVARSIVSTLQRGEMETVDFIDGAGNSSPRLDVVEARGIRLAFPNHYLDIPVSSIKSMVGEGIASGGIRMAADLLIMERDIIPPTINYEYPDPHCALRIVQLPQKAPVRTILHTGISLDGTYVSILLGRADGVL